MAKYLGIWAILICATAMEASGDALLRIGLFEKAGVARLGVVVGGAALLLGYGIAVNLAPLPFERVVGLYIATLFLVWQIVSFFAFRSTPSFPVLIGGTLIVVGGLMVTFWSSGPTSTFPRSQHGVDGIGRSQ